MPRRTYTRNTRLVIAGEARRGRHRRDHSPIPRQLRRLLSGDDAAGAAAPDGARPATGRADAERQQ